jgi:hypothetical protein
MIYLHYSRRQLLSQPCGHGDWRWREDGRFELVRPLNEKFLPSRPREINNAEFFLLIRIKNYGKIQNPTQHGKEKFPKGITH